MCIDKCIVTEGREMIDVDFEDVNANGGSRRVKKHTTTLLDSKYSFRK